MGYQSFKDLKIWQASKELTLKIYNLTKTGKFSKDYALREQIRKASISIPSNIAEGYEIGYIGKDEFNSLDEHCRKLGSMMTNFIKARRKNVKH